MELIADVTEAAIIHADVSKINLTEWLFTLKEHEYQACAAGHIAAGSTFSTDGRRMSLNVEQVADTLLVQHYTEQISRKNHCLVHSISDSFSSAGRSKLTIIWELKVAFLSENSCALSNRVAVGFTPEFLASLTKAGKTGLDAVKSAMAVNVSLHNKEETPLFAKDIEAKALNGVWLL